MMLKKLLDRLFNPLHEFTPTQIKAVNNLDRCYYESMRRIDTALAYPKGVDRENIDWFALEMMRQDLQKAYHYAFMEIKCKKDE